MDALTQGVTIPLGGLDRRLVYNLNALIEFEKASGINVLQAMAEAAAARQQENDGDPTAGVFAFIRGLDPKKIRDFIWAGLLWESPAITPRQVGAWLNLRNLNTAIRAALEALALELPDVNPDEQEDTAAGVPFAMASASG